MATRLSPHTENPAILEKLSGVPAGTAARLAAIQKPFADRLIELNAEFQRAIPPRQDEIYRETSDTQAEEYDAIRKDADVAEFYNFTQSGWGRMDRDTIDTIESFGMDPVCGITYDVTQVVQLLNDQGIRLPDDIRARDLEGLQWG
jgi:hypothetical protein